MLKVIPISAFTDNYIWIILDSTSRHCTIIDPGDAQPVINALEQYKLEPKSILITHQHPDHIGGVSEILKKHPVPVYGPADIEVVTHAVKEGDQVNVLEVEFCVIAVPGHTLNHVVYYGDNKLFCGDTLFSAGCGRMFEGTPELFTESLNKLRQLPDQTSVYCAHEYTQFNLLFAHSVEPENLDIAHYQQQVNELLAENKPSLPSNIGLEKAINPFLRTDQAEVIKSVQQILGREPEDEAETFAVLRELRNSFTPVDV